MLRSLVDRVNTRDFMAIMLSGALVALTFVLALRAPESDAFKVLLGAMLSTGFASAIGFYFNSSKGSDDKNKAIEKATEALAVSTPTPVVTTTTVDPGPPPKATTTTTPVEPEQPLPKP